MQWQEAQRGGSSPIFGKGKGCHSRAHGERVPCLLWAVDSPGKKGGEAIPIGHWGQHLLSLSEQWWQSVFAPG